jgi:hypothetical protein
VTPMVALAYAVVAGLLYACTQFDWIAAEDETIEPPALAQQPAE